MCYADREHQLIPNPRQSSPALRDEIREPSASALGRRQIRSPSPTGTTRLRAGTRPSDTCICRPRGAVDSRNRADLSSVGGWPVRLSFAEKSKGGCPVPAGFAGAGVFLLYLKDPPGQHQPEWATHDQTFHACSNGCPALIARRPSLRWAKSKGWAMQTGDTN